MRFLLVHRVGSAPGIRFGSGLSLVTAARLQAGPVAVIGSRESGGPIVARGSSPARTPVASPLEICNCAHHEASRAGLAVLWPNHRAPKRGVAASTRPTDRLKSRNLRDDRFARGVVAVSEHQQPVAR